jgi:hypothetical protein
MTRKTLHELAIALMFLFTILGRVFANYEPSNFVIYITILSLYLSYRSENDT